MRQSFMLAAMLLMAGPVGAADDGPFVFEFEELAPGIWTGIRPDPPRFPVMGNTTFVISDAGVVVFDGGGMPAMAEQVIDKIRSLTDQPITHVVISHWHGDHHFGISRIAEEYPGVQIIAHEFTRDVINSSRINYIDRGPGFYARNSEEFERIITTGVDAEGKQHSDVDRDIYRRMRADRDSIESEYRRARVTPPNVVFSEQYTITSGARKIELLFLGHGNTAGDIVMWLPDERIVASGDIVVLPSPYAFNVAPLSWVQTLRNLKSLDYAMLVPGHGPVQRDTSYIDLLMDAAKSIAAQRDMLLAAGKSAEEAKAALDFSGFEDRFTHGDEYLRIHYDEWFVQPFRSAAMKALSGEPMVVVPAPESVPFDDARWVIDAAEYKVADYLGQKALQLKDGSALLPDVDLQNALVEFDIAVTPERGFAGLMFRWQDEGNYENFYIRPHQSGNPDANQYQPVINGSATWQLYHGAGYSSPVKYRYNEWQHVRVLYAGSQARVYIDSEVPVLTVTDLKRADRDGAIGISVARFAAARFANFKFTQLANAYAFPPQPQVEYADGIVQSWQVSDAFAESELAAAIEPGDDAAAARVWTPLSAETSGITNLAWLPGGSETDNTRFARHVIHAQHKETRLFSFGYSDRASVYLNGTLIYKGNNNYLSRDYRYLGTIGLFDSVALPLKRGDNELWIAVSEDFGGWGIMGRITEL
jgi:glyoxylase-like metal-dependent hydrolase (beta-lactamase superfamily II)